MSFGVIRSRSESSGVIRSHWGSSGVIGGHQESLGVIRSHCASDVRRFGGASDAPRGATGLAPVRRAVVALGALQGGARGERRGHVGSAGGRLSRAHLRRRRPT
eukprot:4488245-Prymnesium_polylepis.3